MTAIHYSLIGLWACLTIISFGFCFGTAMNDKDLQGEPIEFLSPMYMYYWLGCWGLGIFLMPLIVFIAHKCNLYKIITDPNFRFL